MTRLLPLCLLLLAACTSTGVEDVVVTPRSEFAPERAGLTREPVILIPGILGSRLFNSVTGEIAWGNLSAVISDLEDDLALPINRERLADNRDDIQAYRVLDRAEILLKEGSGEVRFYAELIDFLSSTLGYRPAFGKRFYRGHDLFVFFYDWRRSNVEAAMQLAQFIRDIKRDLGKPDMKFTFVAVSNGGLVARYYLRHGGRDVVSNKALNEPMVPTFAGVKDVNRLICLGTPHRGTVDALHLIHDGYAPNVLARRYPPSTVFSFPSAFELLPEPGEPVFVGPGGETLPIDLWDPAAWKRYGLSVYAKGERARLRSEIIQNIQPREDRDALFAQRTADQDAYLARVLTHARRFRASIEGLPEVPTEVIIGASTPTLARVGLVHDVGDDDDEFELWFRPRFAWGRFDPMADAIFALGDGVVTRRSAMGLFLPQSGTAEQKRGEDFRRALDGRVVTSFQHRTMFEDELLRLALAETLTRP